MHAPCSRLCRLAILLLLCQQVAPQSSSEYWQTRPTAEEDLTAEGDDPTNTDDPTDAAAAQAALEALNAPPAPPPVSELTLQLESEAAYADGMREYAIAAANSTDEVAYTTNPTLARSLRTTPWLDRDRQRVIAQLELQDEDTQLREGNAVISMAGDRTEQELVTYMTRHGLYRRADAKFSEFVPQPTGTVQDGYGLWRVWESDGACPRELLVADPWGGVSWQAPPGPLRSFECTWVIRPGMYRHAGYFKLSRAPIVLTFRTFSLAAPHEVMDIYDGSHTGAPLLARFTGQRTPDQITSTGAEVLIKLSADLDTSADEVWAELDDWLQQGRLREAQHAFIYAARRRIRGFYRQPMRRIIRHLAIRLSLREENIWMRKLWFHGADEMRWDRAYSDALASVLQDATSWEKRSRREEGKEDQPWDVRLSTRRYPINMIEPEQNPYHPGISIERTGGRRRPFDEVDVDQSVQLRRALGFLDEHPSGFSLDFTTSADCYGRGITPYGTGYGAKYGVFPPLTLSSDPARNFVYLPFPLQATSCQPAVLSGPQFVRNRPFTVADSVMKTAQEDLIGSCVHPGRCDLQISETEGPASNCSAACDPFMECVHTEMANRTSWLTSRNMYNKSFAAAARERCISMPEASRCVNVNYPPGTEFAPAQPPWPWTRERPKSALCVDFSCASCAVSIFQTYFLCALECSDSGIGGEPGPGCIDCSYSFEDTYEEIDALRDRMLEAYLSGVFGFHLCPDCVLDSPEMYADGEVPMLPECRRCHYALEDFVNNDVFTCLDSAPELSSRRCFSVDRDDYNYEQDFFNIVKPNADIDLTIAGTGEVEVELGLGGAYAYEGGRR